MDSYGRRRGAEEKPEPPLPMDPDRWPGTPLGPTVVAEDERLRPGLRVNES